MHKPNQAEAAGAAMDPKPARRRKTEAEQLAELDEQRKRIERKGAAVKARTLLEKAIGSLRNGENIDGAISSANVALAVLEPFKTPTGSVIDDKTGGGK